MKKIYFILIIGILLVGTITAVSFSLSDSDFKTKVNTISSKLFYDKLVEINKIDAKDIPKDTNINIDDSLIDITQNKNGVYRVRALR